MLLWTVNNKWKPCHKIKETEEVPWGSSSGQEQHCEEQFQLSTDDSKGSISTILFPAVRKPQLKTADHLSVCEASNRNEAYSMQRSSLTHKTFSLYGKQALPKIEQISQTIIVTRGLGDWQSYPSLFTPLEIMERDCCWFFHLYRLTSILKINEYKNIQRVSGSHLLHWKPISICENSS